MDYLAERMGLNPAQILSTATFYTMYDKEPRGKVHIQVCTTLSCAVCGGYAIMEHLEKKLGINAGETDGEGNYSLSEVECLASCGTAPMFMASFSNGTIEYFENLTIEGVDALLERFEALLPELPNPKAMH